MVLKRTFLYSVNCKNNLLGAGVLGNGLGAFRDGVFGQFSGEEEPDGGLDLPGGDGGPLVVVGQFGSLGSDTLEEIVDERVHDAHGLGGDTGIGVHLLQHLVDVDGIRFLTLVLALLSVLSNGLGGLAGFLGSFSRGLGRHVDSWVVTVKLNDCCYFVFAFILKRSLTLGLRKSPRPPHYGNLCSNGYAGKNSKENGGY